jgi:hypothetical protein
MFAYLGATLFALIFLVMSAQSTGAFGQHVNATFEWIHSWAPFSYILITIILASPLIMLKIMHSWPKHVEPEDPMRKYRHDTSDVIED